MSETAISCIVFACVFGGALLGMGLRASLPEHHLSTDSKDFVKLGTGLIATMAALVLGLLIASAKNSYDTLRTELRQVSANIIVLDRLLAHYGSETDEARHLVRLTVVRAIDRMWPENRFRPGHLEPGALSEELYTKIERLSPQNEAQRLVKVQALTLAVNVAQTRWLMSEQKGGSIPMPLLAGLVFWLSIIFVSFGLFAPPNTTVIATMLLCVLSVSAAIFLILELDQPFDGLIRIPSASLRDALVQLGY